MFSDTLIVNGDPANIGVSFVTLSWTRLTPAGTREDRATCTFAVAKNAGGNLWSTLINADKATAEGHIATWEGTQGGFVANQYTLVEYRWHDWHLSDDALGPADRVTTVALAGVAGATSRLPDQDSCTVTFRTASRKHWGRVYLPGVAITQLDTTYGRWSQTGVDNIANAFHGLCLNLKSSNLDLVVASRKYRGILELSSMEVDNVVDIIRRRRAKQSSYKKEFFS